MQNARADEVAAGAARARGARTPAGVLPVALSVGLMLLAGTATSMAAQDSPHARLPDGGETFCGQVFLRSEGRIFGHEFVEFVHEADVAERPTVVRDLSREPTGADRRAYWWRISSDSIGAFMAGEDQTVWELRLTSASAALEGALRQVVPEDPAAARAAAYAMVTPCRQDPGSPPRTPRR